MSRAKCKVDDCDDYASRPSVLCRAHARDYADWRDRVDLSTVKGETSLTYWLEHGDAPTPKRALRKGQVIAWVIGAKIERAFQETCELKDLGSVEPVSRDVVSVRVSGWVSWGDFAGSVIYGEDEEGRPHRYRAVDGWYASERCAREALLERAA